MKKDKMIIEQCKKIICVFLKDNADKGPEALLQFLGVMGNDKNIMLMSCYELKQLIDTSIDILEKEQEEIENFQEMREQAEMEAEDES